MSNQKVTQLTELTSVNYLDITYIVDDPSGTPASKKSTVQNLVKGGASEGAVSGLIDTDLTASKALASDASGKVVASSVTDTELGYISGVTSAIQTQLDEKPKWHGELASAPGSPASGDMYYNTGDSKVYIYVNSSWAALN
jgi:hypothetical protein